MLVNAERAQIGKRLSFLNFPFAYNVDAEYA
ncbi:hypothetical protein T08_11043 [Trichinella sp. T8]|nr:hypothetical protein T08_11043 [Trichinella sp. T8]